MDARRQRLLVKAGQLSSAPERFEISEHIQPFLRRLIGVAFEKPGIGRHNRIAHDEPGIVEMSELPVAGMKVECTRRIGPDLSREFNLHPRDWQLTHLYNPRLVVRDSVMPPYPWLFSGSANQPTQEGLDVLAYLQSLGRARQLSGFDRQAMASNDTSSMSDMAMASEPSAEAT